MKLNKKVRKFAYASTVVVGALTPYLISGGIVKAETPQDNPVETSEERTGNGIPEDLQETYLLKYQMLCQLQRVAVYLIHV